MNGSTQRLHLLHNQSTYFVWVCSHVTQHQYSSLTKSNTRNGLTISQISHQSDIFVFGHTFSMQKQQFSNPSFPHILRRSLYNCAKACDILHIVEEFIATAEIVSNWSEAISQPFIWCSQAVSHGFRGDFNNEEVASSDKTSGIKSNCLPICTAINIIVEAKSHFN